jgi:hypothetical protein
MIEIIALFAAAALVPAIAVFAWVTNRRVDEAHDEIIAINNALQRFAYTYARDKFGEPKEITEARLQNIEATQKRNVS